MQFCFQKHRSDTWDPKDMFSTPSGRSELHAYLFKKNICSMLKINKLIFTKKNLEIVDSGLVADI